MAPPENPRTRPARSDGEQTRERLVATALALFAGRGFAKTSTRDIAEAAGTNLAAISYYFGDKAGLYREAFAAVPTPAAHMPSIAQVDKLTLRQALEGLYQGFVAPLKQGEAARQCIRLHMREMLEPTGLWEQEIEGAVKPLHEMLVRVLCRHLGLAGPDDEVLRLAAMLMAMGVHLHVGRDVMEALAPTLGATDEAVAAWLPALVRYAEALVAAERARRKAALRWTLCGRKTP